MTEDSGVKHYDVSPAAKSAAEKLAAQLNEADAEAAEAKSAEDSRAEAELQDRIDGNDQDTDTAQETVKTDDAAPEESTDDHGDKPEDEAGQGKDEKADEKPDELSPEEKSIKEQERLLAEDTVPEDRDRTPLAERSEWKRHRLEMRRLKEENERLQRQAQAPAAPLAFTLTPEEAAKEAADLEQKWERGELGDWDYSRLQEEQTALKVAAKMSSIVLRTRQENERLEKQKKMSEAVISQEAALPGLKKAFDAAIRDPLLGGNALLAQIVEKNLQNGSGLGLLFYLHHHRKLAEEILSGSPDESAVRLHEIRTKLMPKKQIAKPGYRPEKPITNSSPYVATRSDREKDESGVQTEIDRHLKRVRPDLYRGR